MYIWWRMISKVENLWVKELMYRMFIYFDWDWCEMVKIWKYSFSIWWDEIVIINLVKKYFMVMFGFRKVFVIERKIFLREI